MALHGTGRLLAEIRGQPYLALFGPVPPFQLAGYSIQALSQEADVSPAFDAHEIGDYWLIAEPDTDVSRGYATPWDQAHAAAAANGYRYYVEPDILHTRAGSPLPATTIPGGFDPNWPPRVAVSPGWHLEGGFTGFDTIRDKATGNGVWIAHLDTGYRPNMGSNPPNLHPDLGYDYWLGKPNPYDPAEDTWIWDMPGHGAATSALLAGGHVRLQLGDHPFDGCIGGAPGAEVIPVRIGPSVIHICTASMAQGIDHARIHQCDVASISHGGLPSQAWAAAVNKAYDAGVNIVAASGDNFYLEFLDLVTRYTVYPSAFNRVITAIGATFDKAAYITSTVGEVQECWGPDPVMAKSVAGYSPNMVWMDYLHPPLGFVMHGQGTSVSTPQVAAACALWLELYGHLVPEHDWLRIEACRHALFRSADKSFPGYDKSTMGQGILRAPELLDDELAQSAIVEAKKAGPSQLDSASNALWDLLSGDAPPGSAIEEQMYEAETAQVVLASKNPYLHAGLVKSEAILAAGGTLPADERKRYRAMLHAEAPSAALRRRLPVG
jgi:hypothetical protein